MVLLYSATDGYVAWICDSILTNSFITSIIFSFGIKFSGASVSIKLDEQDEANIRIDIKKKRIIF
jgi:hypothetical protein